MRNFAYVRATSPQDAVVRSQATPNAQFIAGGTNLIDRLKGFLDEPAQLIDISRLNLGQIQAGPGGGLRVGALATNTAVADHPAVRRDYPLLARAILSGASQQIRNVATVGGNLLQRTRCPYYYDTAFACNKRQPGSGCAALNGINRMHAILGASSRCVAVHPSDMAVALAALDAVVEVEGARGRREIPLRTLHRLPGEEPHRDTTLDPGELITAVVLPPIPCAKTGVYLKLRDRASYVFALVSVAAAVEVKNTLIQDVRLALGGVAHKPWQSPTAEGFLRGRPATLETFEQAADIVLQGAQPLAHNRFKVTMAKRAIQRALALAAQGGGAA
ncbi:MAG: xanthine dehydrogenase family protein subunit M [Cyanobacteria bacterium Co-bin8]|nr:xanthine dehydrogenase family protein subunit M [Cyanobacteria bacterium Co-bin8]